MALGEWTMFEVQTYTFLDGWINCWSEEVNGESHPLTFKTYTAALEELTDFLAANHEAFTNGAVEDQYEPHDYRIMEMR
jgi:hypothetical protein